MRRLRLPEDEGALTSLRGEERADVADAVAAILADVRARGDAAVREATRRFDGAELGELAVGEGELERLSDQAADLRDVLERAADNVRAFHTPQRPRPFVLAGGRLIERIVPLDAVGCYVPGGRAAYPSTVLMNVVPAVVAGVGRIVVTTPPRMDGTIPPVVALAARIAGATEVYRIGGAQAVAALAFGTESIAAVRKIAGPGNAYVAEAKRQVAARVGVDSHAGPSELLVLADDRADPARVARDLIAQAEHDPMAMALCVTTSERIWRELPDAVDGVLRDEPNPVAAESLAGRGAVVLAPSMDSALDFANRFAPEHLQLDADESLASRVTTAGAIFAGGWSPEPVGDYYAGPNHTLPTGGYARFQSALGTADFVRRVHVIRHDAAWLAREGPRVAAFARAEALVGHARAVETRLVDAAAAPPVVRAASDWVVPEVRAQRAYTLEAPPSAPVKLNQNEAPDDWSDGIKRRVLDRLSAIDWRRYPPFDDVEMRSKIAARDGWTAGGVLIGNGSNELLATLFACVVGWGERVAVPDPCFSLYPLHLRSRGADLVRVPLRPETDFAYETEPTLRACRAAKVVVLTSPNNPTGSVLPPELLRRIIDESDALIAIDEAYREWCGQDFAPFLETGRVALLRTFSKALALAGLRFGYLLGPPDLCAEVRKLLLPYNVNAFTRAAVDVLLGEEDALRTRVALVRAERSRVAAALRERGRRVVVGGANFVLVGSEDPPGEFRRLLSAGVLVRDLSASVPGFLRVSVGNAQDNDRFLAALVP